MESVCIAGNDDGVNDDNDDDESSEDLSISSVAAPLE
jgi:hypothetical protein